MQIEVKIEEPMMITSQMNQIRIRFDLNDMIKEAQQKDDQIAKNIEKVQRVKLKIFPLIDVY